MSTNLIQPASGCPPAATPMGLNPSWLYELSGRLLDANAAALQVCGMSREALLKQNVFDVLRGRVGGEDLCDLSGFREVQRPNGLVVHLQVVSTAEKYEGRSVARVTAVWHDFLEAADKRLALLKRCVERIEDAVLVIEAVVGSDEPPRVTYANRACELRSGYRRDELFRSIPHAFADPVQLATALTSSLRADGAATERSELVCRSKDGTAIVLDVETLIPDCDASGRWAWVAIGREKRDVQRQLLEREQQLAGIVETAMDAIITIDDSRRIQVFNRAAAAMFGVAPEKALGRLIEDFVPTRSRSVHAEHVGRFARAGTTVRRMGSVLHVLTGLRADGEEFPIEASISKMDHAGAPWMTAVIRDVSELKRADEARRAQLVAEGSNRAKTEFLSRMSHELRTPLNAVLGFAQLLANTQSHPASQWQQLQLQQICSGGWHLLALIDDVLDVTQIEAGKLRLRTEAVTLDEIVANAVSMLEAKAKSHAVTVRVESTGRDDAVVKGDPTRIRQVVLNILSNAIKYNIPDGSVAISVNRGDTNVILTVQDTGIGMSDDQLAHLFEPFNRLGRGSSGIEGTGIGLFLSRQLVELMGGSLSVTSAPMTGTRVSLCIPAGECGGDTAAQDLPDREAGVRQRLTGPVQGTVLYVEDNDVNYLLVEQMLARWPGVVLKRAHGAKAALEMLDAIAPDVVLLDMQLPDGTGLDVLKVLRASNSGRCLKVIALSASAMPDEVTWALRAGANDYWTKPLDFDAFVYDMAVLLNQSAADAEEAVQ